MIRIDAVQDNGYSKHEYDLLSTNGYVGLMLGTETRNGIIWEIQEHVNGNIGKILRLPAMTKAEALREARSFLS